MEKSLICITTCNRLHEVRKYLIPYVQLALTNESFDFLLALDGNNPEYISFCEEFDLPLLFSDEREGVGLSKNRVLKAFPDYEHYFFIEDDIELLDSTIFDDVLLAAAESGFHHFTITGLNYITKRVCLTNYCLLFGNKGGAQFSHYTKSGLSKVGGWHTEFAKYRRFGHTEHSYRYVTNNLQPNAFICVENCLDKILIHDPPHVTHIDIDLNEMEISKPEQIILDQKLQNFQLTTLSTFHFNEKNVSQPGNESLLHLMKCGDRYALVNDPKAKRHVKVEYKVNQLRNTRSTFGKLKLLLEIVFLAPRNNAFKHWVKQNIKRKDH